MKGVLTCVNHRVTFPNLLQKESRIKFNFLCNLKFRKLIAQMRATC